MSYICRKGWWWIVWPNQQIGFEWKWKIFFFQIFLLCWDWGEDKVRRAFISEAVNFRKDTASGDKQANDHFVFYFKQRNSELSKLVQKYVKSFVFSKLMFFMWKSSLLSELVQIFISTCVNFVCTIWRVAGFCTETILNSIIVLFLGSAMGRELNRPARLVLCVTHSGR